MNWRHEDFQSTALPTELSRLFFSSYLHLDNKLNTFDGGMMKYWVDSHDYGVVETAHQVLLHSILGEDD